MSLHLVFSVQGFYACQTVLDDKDHIVFIGDGVYAARDYQDDNFSVIAEDLKVRGLPAVKSGHGISYSQLVTLCTEHHPNLSWKG